MEYNVNIYELVQKLEEAQFAQTVGAFSPATYDVGVQVYKCHRGTYEGELVVAIYDVPTGELMHVDVCHTIPGERPRFTVDNWIVVCHPSYVTETGGGLRVYKQFDPYLEQNPGMWMHAGPDLMPMVFTSLWEAETYINNENRDPWRP